MSMVNRDEGRGPHRGDDVREVVDFKSILLGLLNHLRLEDIHGNQGLEGSTLGLGGDKLIV